MIIFDGCWGENYHESNFAGFRKLLTLYTPDKKRMTHFV